MQVQDFDAAVRGSEKIRGKRHLLLGNGFSISCRPDLFTYGRLFDEADFQRLSADAAELFGLFGTTDFERVIEALRVSADVVRLYAERNSKLAEQLSREAQVVRDALAAVLAARHPANVSEIGEFEYRSARRFLEHFPGKIYTLNYDLLLYWALIQDLDPSIESDDGFRADKDDPEAEWMTWDGYAGHSQRIYHLHGGLHLFDAGTTLRKLTWCRTGVALIDQIRNALDNGTYPLVVTEGTSDEKLARIEHSPYLHRGLKSLTQCQGSLFILGHSLAPNDEHILERIERGGFRAIYVGLHGDPEAPSNAAIRERAELMADRRLNFAPKRPLKVDFYRSDTAKVWR